MSHRPHLTAPTHEPIIPPGMAYAAREANRALEVRLEREHALVSHYRDLWLDEREEASGKRRARIGQDDPLGLDQ